MIPLITLPIPAIAWTYTDGTPSDTKYEKFGPRADNLFIGLYASAEAEWDALETGEIDITDWPLTAPYYDRFTTSPQNEDIAVIPYGAEFGLFLLDINNNPNEFLGNPPDPTYSNPVYPNPCAAVNLRQAIWHLHNKPTWLPSVIGTGFYEDLYTVVPPCYGAYSLHPYPNPYPYDPSAAIAKLESDVYPADGMPDFPQGGDGWRFWDLDGDGVEDPDEGMGPGEPRELIFQIRTDHPHRNQVGDLLADELDAIGISVKRNYGPVLDAVVNWFFGKATHLYTAGWGLGVDPDHVILWASLFYWHPGFCYNTGFVNDTELDQYALGVYLANTESEALVNCHAFQDRFAEIAGAVPWWSYAGSKAVRRRYTGGTNEVPQTPDDGENAYRGNYWDGVVSVPGYGLDSGASFMNMHPRGFDRGIGENMTIRWAFKTSELKSFNPVYAEWVWEWNVLGLIYDSLLSRDPYTLLPMPWMANFSVGTYEHETLGTCTKVSFSLRHDIYWADGTPLTTADIYFTFVELDDILAAHGLPPPWWYSSVAHILSFSILDPYNFEVLLDVKSVYSLMWPGGNVILPKHIWRPLAEAGPGVIDEPAPDPNMIGSGPWRFVSYQANSHVLLTANRPGSIVTTNHAGSTPVVSPKGYFRWGALGARRFSPTGERFKFDVGTQTVEYIIENAHENDITINFTITLPNGTELEYLNQVIPGFGELVVPLPWTPEYGLHLFESEITATSHPVFVGLDTQRVAIWVTVKEDVAGSTWYDDLNYTAYPYKDQLETPDFSVDLKDVFRTALAFGSYPGHIKWNSICDIDGSYGVDLKDYFAIATMFGWAA